DALPICGTRVKAGVVGRSAPTLIHPPISWHFCFCLRCRTTPGQALTRSRRWFCRSILFGAKSDAGRVKTGAGCKPFYLVLHFNCASSKRPELRRGSGSYACRRGVVGYSG